MAWYDQAITLDIKVILNFKIIHFVNIIKREEIWNWLEILWRKFFKNFNCLFEQVLLNILQSPLTFSYFLPEFKHSLWLVLKEADTHFTSSVILRELNLLLKACCLEALLNNALKFTRLEFFPERFAPLYLFVQNVWIKNSRHENILISVF